MHQSLYYVKLISYYILHILFSYFVGVYLYVYNNNVYTYISITGVCDAICDVPSIYLLHVVLFWSGRICLQPRQETLSQAVHTGK